MERRPRTALWIGCSLAGHALVIAAALAWGPGLERSEAGGAPRETAVEFAVAPEARSGTTANQGEARREEIAGQPRGSAGRGDRSRPREERYAAAVLDPFAIDGVATEHADPGAPGARVAASPAPVEPVPAGAGGGGGREGERPRGDGELTGVDAEAVWRAVQRAARYPRLAESMGLKGRVVVRFRVDGKGEPREIRVIEPVDELLDEAAVQAVRDAAPFRSPEGWVRVPVEFSLRPAP